MPKWVKWVGLLGVILLLASKNPDFWHSAGQGVQHIWGNITAFVDSL